MTGKESFEAVKMLHAAEKAGVRHMTAFTYRFVPAMRYMAHLVKSGFIGRPYHFRSCRLQDWGTRAVGWRQVAELAGSGELGDMLSHRIDYAHLLVGPISWRWVLAAGALPAVIALGIRWFVPESERWQRVRSEEEIAGTTAMQTFTTMFQPSLRRRTVVGVLDVLRERHTEAELDDPLIVGHGFRHSTRIHHKTAHSNFSRA